MMEFESPATFARHLARMAAAGDAVSSHIVKKAATLVQKDAQDRIGEYQDGGNGFPAWANLAESTIADRIRKGFSPDEPLLRTGELRGSIEVEVSGSEAVVATADIVALYQEQGTEHIPPRPFLGPAAADSQKTIGASVAAILIAWVSGASWRARGLKLPSP